MLQAPYRSQNYVYVYYTYNITIIYNNISYVVSNYGFKIILVYTFCKGIRL